MSRTYAVTGSAMGIGKATRETLEAAGHRVIGIDLKDAEVEIDLADVAQRAILADRVGEASGGSLDAVIAVAGIAAGIPDAIRVNFFGARDTLVGLRPLLLSSPAPRAAVVSSISAVHPHLPELTDAMRNGDEDRAVRIAEDLIAGGGQPGYIYTSSKRAISEWVRQAAITDEWAGAGIALNAVAPGTFVTRLTKDYVATPEGRAMLARSTPMPLHGPGEPEVVGRALAWLTSEENSHITGQTVFVDGGSEAVMRGPQVFGRPGDPQD